jgi:uncharacterized protein (DUF305 family)
MISLQDISDEFGEAEIYYTTLINHKYQEINKLNLEDPKQKEILRAELQEMDRLFHSLQKDFQANPTDKRIINAMISHYQLKLDVMNQIVTQLKEVKHINKTYYEGKKS